MNHVSTLTLNFGHRVKLENQNTSIGHTDEEKEICLRLTEYFEEDKHLMAQIGAMKINFDLKLKRDSLVIRGVYLIDFDGSPEYHRLMKTYMYKSRPNRNILSTTLRKAGALFMVKNISNLTELRISRLNIFVISLMTISALISGISLIGLNYIPSPIDMALFWSSAAGALGLLVDNWKRKFANGGNK